MFVADVSLTFRALDNLSLMLTAENIDYSDEFKQAFGVVPVEKRRAPGMPAGRSTARQRGSVA